MKDRFRQLRKAVGLTQASFAAKLSLSQNYIAQIEIGTKVPPERTIADVCRTFNINKEWLLTGNGDMFVPQSADEQLAKRVGELLADRDDSFRKRFLTALLEMPADAWPYIERFIESIKKDPAE